MTVPLTKITRDGVNNMHVRIKVGAVLLAVTFLATFLSILLGCQPISKHWQINPDPGSMSRYSALPYREWILVASVLISSLDFCQPAVSRLQVAVLITLNISTDIYLMSVPLPVSSSHRSTGIAALLLLTEQSVDLESSTHAEEEIHTSSHVQRWYPCHCCRSTAMYSYFDCMGPFTIYLGLENIR